MLKKNRSAPNTAVIPVLYYPDVREAVEWLTTALPFTERLRNSDNRCQLLHSNGAIVVALIDDNEVTLKRLRRTAVGAFAIEAAITLEELESRGAPCAESKLLPIDAALAHLPAIRLAATVAAQVLRGQRVAVQADETTHARLYDGDSDRFLGVGRVVDGTLQARRLVASDTRNCLR